MALRSYCTAMTTNNKTMSAKNDFRFSRYFVFQMRVGFERTRKSWIVVTGELSFIHLLWFASRADSYSTVWLSCTLIKIYNYF